MKNKIWKYKGVDLFLSDSGNCTQKYVEDNYELIAETNEDLKSWFENFAIGSNLYDVHQISSYHDTNYEIKNIFVSGYTTKTLKQVQQNPQIENMNNAICPVCGYIDYYCWEINCPDENYRCPQCKSSLLLEHRFDGDYDGYSTVMYQRTTFKKMHKPQKISISEE